MPRYAAIDIGSNSVRMMAAEVERATTFRVLAEDRQVTRLGESVFRTGSLDAASIEQLCRTLERMAAAYRPLGVLGVRAVATAAVRDAANGAEFLERASTALGAAVEVISGQEEARLITLIFPATTFFSFPYLYLIHTLYCVKMVDEYLFPAKILKLTRSVIFS